MRLNRFLASAGLGARRKCEDLIRDGRIEVNREVVRSLAVQIDPAGDIVTCDGERLRLPRNLIYSAMNKPAGLVVSASDEKGRATVYDLLPGRLRGRVRAVGRLDQGSEGLLLFTNDGLLSNALLHPRARVPRTYMVWVRPPPDPPSIASLREGVALGRGERSGPAEVRLLAARGGIARLRVTLGEGKNREIRRMFRSVGCRVVTLRRIQFGGVSLGELHPGQVRPLTAAEVESLRRAAGVTKGG